MKLKEIFEHEIVSKKKQKPVVLKKDLKMKKTELPFTKGFKSLRKIKRAKRIKNPVGGKVLKHI